MGKMATTLDDKLPAFQKYLLEKNLAPAKNMPFYAHWVSRFLDYARRNEFSLCPLQSGFGYIFTSLFDIPRFLIRFQKGSCLNSSHFHLR